jgi:hypothetical protein
MILNATIRTAAWEIAEAATKRKHGDKLSRAKKDTGT